MKLDFNAVLMSLSGKPMKGEPIFDEHGNTSGERKDATLGAVAIEALLNLKADEGSSGQKKMDRYRLASKVQVAMDTKETVDLKVEEVSLLKEEIGKWMNAAAVGSAWDEIERQGRSPKVEEKSEEVK